MSMELMVRAMKIKVGNPLRKLVLVKLADNASDQGECWPSVGYIAEQCEISERSVQKHIQCLAKDGLLRVEVRPNRSNVYHLTLRGESPAPGGESPAPGGESPAPVRGESPAPRISHSFESVSESVSESVDGPSDDDPLPKKNKKPEKKFDPMTLKPGNVSEAVWSEWIKHRRDKKQPLTETSCHRQAKSLQDHPCPDDVIIKSITCGWTGLFPEKVAVMAGGRHRSGDTTQDLNERKYEASVGWKIDTRR